MYTFDEKGILFGMAATLNSNPRPERLPYESFTENCTTIIKYLDADGYPIVVITREAYIIQHQSNWYTVRGGPWISILQCWHELPLEAAYGNLVDNYKELSMATR